jgi:uncharacterized membrane protein YfcA
VAISYAIAGAAAGMVVGLTSTGGGALLTPALILLGVPPSICVGVDVLAAAGMKLFGGGLYALRREVHWPTVVWLAIGSVPGALLGIATLNRFPNSVLDAGLPLPLGAMVFVAGVSGLIRMMVRAPGPRAMPSALLTVGFGFGTGFLVSTTSIGSGSLLLCVLSSMYPLSAHTLIGTDLVHALIVSSVATAGHFRAGRVDWHLAANVLAGGVPGVFLGARLAWVTPQRTLRVGLAIALVAIGAHLAWTGAKQRNAVLAAAQRGAPR